MCIIHESFKEREKYILVLVVYCVNMVNPAMTPGALCITIHCNVGFYQVMLLTLFARTFISQNNELQIYYTILFH